MVTKPSMGNITFTITHPDFKLKNRLLIKDCLYCFISDKKFIFEEINFVFCDDDYLLNINKKYLNHNTLTDIITFDYGDKKKTIAGDIFISVERVEENAHVFGVTFHNELFRVMSHGILHLMGFADKTKAESLDMRAKEADALMYFDKLL